MQKGIITLQTDEIKWTARLCDHHYSINGQVNNTIARDTRLRKMPTREEDTSEDQALWETKLDEIREFCRTEEEGMLQPEDADKLIEIYQEIRHVFSNSPEKVKDFQCRI